MKRKRLHALLLSVIMVFSMAANMLAAYYGRGCDSSAIFKEYQIAKSPTYREHLNKYDVIFLNIQNLHGLKAL